MEGREMSKISITVPRVPCGANKLMRMHYRERTDLRRGWESDIFHLLTNKDKRCLKAWRDLREGLDQKTPIRIHIVHKREFDPDNLFSAVKIPLDALANLGFIRDDSHRFITLEVTQEKSVENQTVIEIEGPQ